MDGTKNTVDMGEEDGTNPLPSSTMQKDVGRNDATIVNRIVLPMGSLKETSTKKNDKEELDDTYDMSSNSSEDDMLSPSKLFDLIYSNDSSDAVFPQSPSTKEEVAECKSTPTTTQTMDTTTSSAATNDDTTSSSSADRQSSEKITAPEPPRWRFINEAKKSLGYSSIHAGSYIEGRSSDELGAKYFAPDISMYKNEPKKEKFIKPAAQRDDQLSMEEESSTDNNYKEVGKLNFNNLFAQKNVPSSNESNNVGKLQINDTAILDENHKIGGKAIVICKHDDQLNETPNKSFKEWGTNIEVGQKNDREYNVHNGKMVTDAYKMPDVETPNKKNYDEVGRLKFMSNGHTTSEDFHVGKRVCDEQDEKEGGDDGKSVHSDMIGGGLFVDRNDNETCDDVESCTNNPDANIEMSNDNDLSKGAVVQQTSDKDVPAWKKKRRCVILLLCLLAILAIVLGATLGKRNDDDEDRSAAAVLVPPVVVSNETNTTECPIETKPFAIMHPQQYSEQTSEFTWELKDACSGLVVASCLPCSLASMSEPQQDGNSIQSQGEPTRRHLKDDQLLHNSANECLPINNEYVFNVLPADEPCCGFDATFSIVLYDNVIIQYGASDDSVYFGERETPCVSEIPSSYPTIEESATPSITKSQLPSSAPSFPPTNVPTTSPVVSLGPCPETYVLLSYYNIGALVELNGIVYECIRDACGGPYDEAELGSSTSDLWREGWKVTGSCSGTKAPSNNPTISVSTS